MPTLIRQGTRAQESGDWVVAHDRYVAAAASDSKYAALAEQVRVKAARQLLDRAATEAVADRVEVATTLVVDALGRARPEECNDAWGRARDAFVAAFVGAVADRNVHRAYMWMQATNVHFPNALPKDALVQVYTAAVSAARADAEEGRCLEVLETYGWVERSDPSRVDVVGTERLDLTRTCATRWIDGGRLEDAVGLFDRLLVADPARADLIDRARSEARRAAGDRALTFAMDAVRAGNLAEGWSWFDRGRAAAGNPPAYGQLGIVPGTFVEAGRKVLAARGPIAAFDVLIELDHRFPGYPTIEGLRGEARRAVPSAVRALLAEQRFDDALALVHGARTRDPRGSYAKLETEIRRSALSAGVDRARAAWGARDLEGALRALEAVAPLNVDRLPLVSPGDPLPRDLAAAVDAVRGRDETLGYQLAVRLSVLFTDDPSVRALLSACRQDARDRARTLYLDGEFDRADALFDRVRQIDPEAAERVDGWRRDARAMAAQEALSRSVAAARSEDPRGAFVWVDRAVTIGVDPADLHEAIGALVQASSAIARKQGLVAGYTFLDEVARRFPGDRQLVGARAEVRAGAYAEADVLVRAGRFEEALGVLEVVRRADPSAAAEVEERTAAVRSTWSAAARLRREWAVVYVLGASAARPDRSAARPLLETRGFQVGVVRSGAWAGTATDAAWESVFRERPGFVGSPGDTRDGFAGRIELARRCETDAAGAAAVDEAVQARTATLAALAQARQAAAEPIRELQEVERRVAVVQAAADRVAAGAGSAAASRDAAVQRLQAAEREAERAGQESTTASAAWQAIEATCAAGRTAAEPCREARRAWTRAKRTENTAQHERRKAAQVLEGIHQAIAAGDGPSPDDVTLAARLDEATRRLGAAQQAAGPALAAWEAAERAVVQAEDLVVTREAAGAPERVCVVELKFTNLVTPSGTVLPPSWREERRSASANPDSLLAEADRAMAARLQAWLAVEAAAAQRLRAARARSARALDPATGDWLVAWWVAPDTVPEGFDAFLQERWPGITRGQLR